MKHFMVGLAAIVLLEGFIIGMIFGSASRNEERVASIEARFIGKCVTMEPFASAKVVAHLESRGLWGEDQFQLVTKDSAGKQDLMFVPEKAVINLIGQPCPSR